MTGQKPEQQHHEALDRRTASTPRRLCGVRSAGPRLAAVHDQTMSRNAVRPPVSKFAGLRFPPKVIVPAVRWHLRFTLSYRDAEELLAERGLEIDHVTVYRWVHKTPSGMT